MGVPQCNRSLLVLDSQQVNALPKNSSKWQERKYKIDNRDVLTCLVFVHSPNKQSGHVFLSRKNVKVHFKYQSVSHFSEIVFPCSAEVSQIDNVYKMAENRVADDATVHVPLCIKY